jgi:hypothetical protein
VSKVDGRLSDKQKVRIAELWAEGLSSTEIGRRMGRTKNSVIGHVHRLGLTKRMSPIRSRTVVPPTPPRAPSSPAVTLPPLREICPVFVATSPRPIFVTKPLPVSIVPLQHKPIKRDYRCEYLSGSTKPYVRCPAPSIDGSYCKAHGDLCHVPKRRERVE